MKRARVLALSVAAVPALLAFAGCRNLLDLDAYDFSGTSSTTGGGGAGGSENPCDAGLVPGACGDGRKCALASSDEGLDGGAVCKDAGTTKAWSLCSDDDACEDATFCDPATGVCKPWCVDGDDSCPDGASCVSARSTDGTVIAGVSVCTAHCRPKAPAERCGPGVSCVLVSVPGSQEADEGDCVATAGKGAGCNCNAADDCDPGLRCDLTEGECRAWCTVGATCPGGPACGAEIIEYEGEELGQCPPPAGMCIE